MAKRGRKPKGIAIDELPDDVRRDIDLAIESEQDESVRSLYARFGLAQRGLGWAVFEKYAATKRREARGRRIEARLDSIDDMRTEADLIAELRRRCYVEALASLSAGDAKLYEIVSTLARVFDFDRLQMERAAEKRAEESHQAKLKKLEPEVKAAISSSETQGSKDLRSILERVAKGELAVADAQAAISDCIWVEIDKHMRGVA